MVLCGTDMGWGALGARVSHNTRMDIGFQKVSAPALRGKRTAEYAEDAEGGLRGRSPSKEEMR